MLVEFFDPSPPEASQLLLRFKAVPDHGAMHDCQIVGAVIARHLLRTPLDAHTLFRNMQYDVRVFTLKYMEPDCPLLQDMQGGMIWLHDGLNHHPTDEVQPSKPVLSEGTWEAIARAPLFRRHTYELVIRAVASQVLREGAHAVVLLKGTQAFDLRLNGRIVVVQRIVGDEVLVRFKDGRDWDTWVASEALFVDPLQAGTVRVFRV